MAGMQNLDVIQRSFCVSNFHFIMTAVPSHCVSTRKAIQREVNEEMPACYYLFTVDFKRVDELK